MRYYWYNLYAPYTLSIRTYAYIHVTCMQYTVYTYDAASGLRQIAGTKHTLQANALIYHIDLIVTAWHRPHMANLIGTATWKHHVWRRHHSLNRLIWLQLTSAGKKVFEGMPFQFQVKSPLHTVETNLEATHVAKVTCQLQTHIDGTFVSNWNNFSINFLTVYIGKYETSRLQLQAKS